MSVPAIFPSFSGVVQSRWTDFLLIGGAAIAFALAIIASSGQFNAFMGPSSAVYFSYVLYGSSFTLFVLEIIKFGYRSIKEEYQEMEGYRHNKQSQVVVKEGGKYLLHRLRPSAFIKKFTVFGCSAPQEFPCRHDYKMTLADGEKIEGTLDGVDLYILANSRAPDSVEGFGWASDAIFKHLSKESYGCPQWELDTRFLTTREEIPGNLKRKRRALECSREVSPIADATLRRADKTATQVLEEIFMANGIRYK